MILLVAASERGRAQTISFRVYGVAGRNTPLQTVSRIVLERTARGGNSPVGEN